MSNSLHDLIGEIDLAVRPSKDIPRGRFDAAVFVREGGNAKRPPYLDIVPGDNCGYPVLVQRCFIDCTLIRDYETYAIQGDAALTACRRGEPIDGNSASLAPAYVFATKPEYLCEYNEALDLWKLWVNAASARTAEDFRRIRAEAEKEAERKNALRQKVKNSMLSAVAFADDEHTPAYPSACNRIVQRGCTWELVTV